LLQSRVWRFEENFLQQSFVAYMFAVLLCSVSSFEFQIICIKEILSLCLTIRDFPRCIALLMLTFIVVARGNNEVGNIIFLGM